MTVVVTDSAASVPAELIDRYGIRVVPMNLRIGARDYTDGDLPMDELLDHLDEGVSTSAPSPGAWLEAFATASGDGILAVTVSSRMSAAYSSATLAARGAAEEVRVVDSGTAAGGQGLVAVAAARAAARGDSLGEVESAATAVAARVSLVATLDDLSRLVQSGRVPSVAGWAGRKLQVNPMFEFRDGEAHALRPAFSRRAALDRITERCRGSRPSGDSRLHAAALHAAAADDAERLLSSVSDGQERGDCFVAPFSPVMVSHTGPGLVGLAWWWDA